MWIISAGVYRSMGRTLGEESRESHLPVAVVSAAMH